LMLMFRISITREQDICTTIRCPKMRLMVIKSKIAILCIPILWSISTCASPFDENAQNFISTNCLSSDVVSIAFIYFLNSAHPSLKYHI
jgi:hypothetical protein